VQPVLKDLGYRRTGSTFQRTIEPDGLVHVVEFQRGGFIHTVPGERRVTTQYGGFTVNLGVWLPGVRQQMLVPREWNDAMEGKTISSASCQLRQRLGQSFPVPCDYWWPVADSEAAQVVAAGLAGCGLPWLDGFVSWDHILHQFEQQPIDALDRSVPGSQMAGRLLPMCMRLARGDHDMAERAFAETLAYLAARPSDPRLRGLNPGSSVVPFIESLERLAVAHHLDVDVRAFAAQARAREQEERRAFTEQEGTVPRAAQGGQVRVFIHDAEEVARRMGHGSGS